jgi:hypothetical protein
MVQFICVATERLSPLYEQIVNAKRLLPETTSVQRKLYKGLRAITAEPNARCCRHSVRNPRANQSDAKRTDIHGHHCSNPMPAIRYL